MWEHTFESPYLFYFWDLDLGLHSSFMSERHKSGCPFKFRGCETKLGLHSSFVGFGTQVFNQFL